MWRILSGAEAFFRPMSLLALAWLAGLRARALTACLPPPRAAGLVLRKLLKWLAWRTGVNLTANQAGASLRPRSPWLAGPQRQVLSALPGELAGWQSARMVPAMGARPGGRRRPPLRLECLLPGNSHGRPQGG
jgi:hypothetical protein